MRTSTTFTKVALKNKEGNFYEFNLSSGFFNKTITVNCKRTLLNENGEENNVKINIDTSSPVEVFFYDGTNWVKGNMSENNSGDTLGWITLRKMQDVLDWSQGVKNGTKINNVDCRTGNVQLANDIDMSDASDFVGIELYNSEYGFAGKFDGKGKTVTLKIKQVRGDRAGFFRILSSGAVVENLTIKGSIEGDVGVAGIVATAKNATINNCTNKASITGYMGIGGIVNSGYYITITGCENYGALKNDAIPGSVDFLGGIAGKITSKLNQPSLIKDCNNYGDILNKNFDDNVGGIVGFAYNYSRGLLKIENCTSTTVKTLVGKDERL